MNNKALQLQDIGVSYRRKAGVFKREAFWALRGVTFDLFHGETLGVIGRNGVGKSTLLRVIANIIKPDKGRIVSYNSGIASLLSLQVGFVNHLTGRENAILSGMLLGMARQDIEDRMDEIIAFSEIGGFIDQPVHTYSTGMRARLGFSVSFLADPDIILLDETLGVGDARFRQKSAKAMREKIRSDKTIVLVSHNPGMVRELCDRAVWIDGGVTKEEGPVENVLNSYTKFLAVSE